MTEPTVTYTVRELLDQVIKRLDALERSAARQNTVRVAVALSLISGPGAVLLSHWIH